MNESIVNLFTKMPYSTDEPSASPCGSCGSIIAPVAHPFTPGKWLITPDLCDSCSVEKEEAERKVQQDAEAEERRQALYTMRLEKAGIPKIMIHETRAKRITLEPRLDMLVKGHPRDPHSVDGASMWAMYVHGTPGTGKSLQGACAIGTYLRHHIIKGGHDVTAKYCDIKTDLAKTKRGFGTGESLVDWAALESCDFLVIDDLARENSSSYNADVIDQLIEARYAEMRRTLFISNVPLGDLYFRQGEDGASGHANYDERVSSRIYQMIGGSSPAIIHMDTQYRVVT